MQCEVHSFFIFLFFLYSKYDGGGAEKAVLETCTIWFVRSGSGPSYTIFAVLLALLLEAGKKESSQQNCCNKMLAHGTFVLSRALKLVPFDICPNLHKFGKAHKLIKFTCEHTHIHTYIHTYIYVCAFALTLKRFSHLKCGRKLCAPPRASAFNWGLPNIFSIYGLQSKSLAALSPVQSSPTLDPTPDRA